MKLYKDHQKMEDIRGKVFNRLTVIDFSHKNKEDKSFWNVKCSCGNELIVKRYSLTSGKTKSCGCHIKENWHNLSRSRFYSVWRAMKKRTVENTGNDVKSISYKKRGITMCKKWLDFKKFKEDMYNSYLEFSKLYGEKNIQIERRNNDKGYYKSNCTWATPKQQARNRSTTKLIIFKRESLLRREWAEKIGISPQSLDQRLAYGWPLEKALTVNKRNEC